MAKPSTRQTCQLQLVTHWQIRNLTCASIESMYKAQDHDIQRPKKDILSAQKDSREAPAE